MSRFRENSKCSRMTPSPSRMQYNDNISPGPSSIKRLYSKIISSCQRSERMSCSLTPENKENMHRMISPFMKKKPPFNPFNQNLRERLEHPILSPDLFSNVKSPGQELNEFKWTIDELSKINPAQIEEEFHYEEQVDEQTETEMQKTIDRYFTKNHMVPSPWGCKLPTSWNSFREVYNNEKQKLLLNEHVNPLPGSSSPYSFPVQLVPTSPAQNVSTQTSLSLPPELPENINSLLKPYFNETGAEDMNTSMNSSLRRKLFFQNDDDLLSPVKIFDTEESSPLIDKNKFPSTPIIEIRSDYTPLKNLSPVDISPIVRSEKRPMCNDTCSAMQIDSALEITKETTSTACNTNSNKLFLGECFKVFESPKLSRRNRKRRRTSSEDFNMSISYSAFAANHNSTEQISQKICNCNESRMSVDADTNELLIESQDTGYGTVCSSQISDKSSKTDPNFKYLTFNLWKNENKENLIVASTPTKHDRF